MAVARRTVPALPQRDSAVGPMSDGDVPALPTSLLLVLAALSACITAQGGYYTGGQLVTGFLLAGALVVGVRHQPLSGHELRLGPVLASAGLAGWTIVTTLAVGGEALPVLGLLAAICAVLLVCRRTPAKARDPLAVALLGIGVLVALSGWAGVAWRIDPLALEDQELWRAATTLTYANATAGLLVPLVLLALGRQLTHEPSGLPVRAAVTCVLLAGAGATLSRGGGVALMAGVVALAALTGVGRTARALVGPTLGAVLALGALAPSMPTASSTRPALAVLGLAAGAMLATALDRAHARVQVGATVLLVAAAALLVMGPLDRVGQSVSDARVTLASDDRLAETAAALRLLGDPPIMGTGPGGATLFFWGPDGEPLAARDAHNEYLQMLAELGAVGLTLTVVLLIALARTVRAGRAIPPKAGLWAGAAAGLVALAVHSAFDFLWHVPAIPLAAAALVGLTIHAPPTAKEHV